MAFSSHTVALLRSIVAPNRDPQPEDVSALLSQTTDWEEVLSAASLHGVSQSLCSRLSQFSEQIPDEIVQTLRAEYERNAFHCLTNAAELHALLNAFQESGIRVMPFKGVTNTDACFEAPPSDSRIMMPPFVQESMFSTASTLAITVASSVIWR